MTCQCCYRAPSMTEPAQCAPCWMPQACTYFRGSVILETVSRWGQKACGLRAVTDRSYTVTVLPYSEHVSLLQCMYSTSSTEPLSLLHTKCKDSSELFLLFQDQSAGLYIN